MSISLNLTDEQAAQLQQRAAELGVDVQELASAVISDLLARPDEELDRAAETVLKNVSSNCMIS